MLTNDDKSHYIDRWINDWNAFAFERLGVRLDLKQQELLWDVQHERRVLVKSGHARGKDYFAAVASVCFLNLKKPSKVISTAPTGRQVYSIMMSELKTIYRNARQHELQRKIPLSGLVQNEMIKMETDDHFLLGFKAGDKSTEAWTGFHSPNLMVVVTEASGVSDETFDAIEGLLTGDSKLLLIFNPNKTSGAAYRASKSKFYKRHTLSCLDAPNVVEKKIIIPGQVDYQWVADHVEMWCSKIDKEDRQIEFYDFEFENQWYRPNNLFRVKVMGEFGAEGDNQLIPLAWIEAANERWLEMERPVCPKIIGIDVAGMGRDKTIYAPRYLNYIDKLQEYSDLDHMESVGKMKKQLIAVDDVACIDTIGEGAGMYSRGRELNLNVISAKFSKSAKGLTDKTQERTFANMRAYCYWALRDALDPKLGGDLALPPDDELSEELNSVLYSNLSNGDIIIEPKENIIKRISRSPDKADAAALSYYPVPKRNYGKLFSAVGRE